MKKIILSTVVLASMTISSLQAGHTELGKCLGCHGKSFEKSALGKSKIVKDMTEKDIERAIKGYQDGTYGGAMKTLMVNQIKDIKDIKNFSKKIFATAGHKPSSSICGKKPQ